eukprot:83147_1
MNGNAFEFSHTTSIQRVLSIVVDERVRTIAKTPSSVHTPPNTKNWTCTKQNWFKQCFLLFWSLASGYGIVFAIESFFYEYFGVTTHLTIAIKGIIAVSFGIMLGIIHFILTVDDGSPKIHPLLLKFIAEQQKKSQQLIMTPYGMTSEFGSLMDSKGDP